MAIHEECGVFGVMSTQKENVAGITYYGLYALQHRGQESCGIVVNDDGVFSSYKDLGLVSEVFSKDTLSHLPEGTMAVGHVRYGTTGGTTRNNCQPIEVNHQKGKMALAHNGNLSNALELRDKLELSGATFSYHQRYRNHCLCDYKRKADDTEHRRSGKQHHEFTGRGLFISFDVSYKDDCCKRPIWIQTTLLWTDAGWSLCSGIRKLRIISGRRRICQRSASG